MKILFLHGWHSVPGGVKPTFLAQHGHEVVNPKLPDDFNLAVQIAQAEFDKHQPDVVVGSSRGGGVAMNINSGDTRLVLLCPAWKKWGTARTVKPGTLILHSRADDVIPFADSEELVRSSGLPFAPSPTSPPQGTARLSRTSRSPLPLLSPRSRNAFVGQQPFCPGDHRSAPHPRP